MEQIHTDADLETVSRLVADLFTISSVYKQDNTYVLSLTSSFQQAKAVFLLQERLKTAGYTFTLINQGESVVLTIDPKLTLKIPRLNLLLFILTLLSVYIVPVFFSNLTVGLEQAAKMLLAPQTTSLSFAHEITLIMTGIQFTWFETVADLAAGAGIEFTLAMISILLIHEMGHFIAGRRRQIITSWPYFIPAPNIIGTFGAVIKSKSPFWNRRDLIEVGAAGPIAGWIVAVGWLVYGLSKSTILSQTDFSSDQMLFSLEGESVLMHFLAPILIGPLPADHFYHLTEAAFAGWVGLLVTAINLLPIGQLDGGHIAYGLGKRNQYALGKIAMVGLVLLGFSSATWWFFAAFGMFFGVNHPPTLNDERPLSKVALAMGIISCLILIVSFTPIPFR
jgi:membrane-associated protease RseP (regulator of RpoE activity)